MLEIPSVALWKRTYIYNIYYKGFKVSNEHPLNVDEVKSVAVFPGLVMSRYCE